MSSTPCGGDARGDDADAQGVAAPAAEIEETDQCDQDDEVDQPPEQEVVSADAKAEAVSLEHLMTHLPNNAHCSACQRATMVKKHARTQKRDLDQLPTTLGEQAC